MRTAPSLYLNQGRPGFWVIRYTALQGLFTSGVQNISIMGIFGISLALLITNFRYTVYNASIDFGYIGRNLGYLGEFFSSILVYHHLPWPTLLNGDLNGV